MSTAKKTRSLYQDRAQWQARCARMAKLLEECRSDAWMERKEERP